jgi:hypothetical protein
MEIATTSRVVARNGIGQFIRECELAAEKTIEEVVKDGENLSKGFAPVGHKADPRTPTLREGMFSEVLSRTSGRWGCAARHALPIEKGAGPHAIPGNVRFFWDAMGRWWVPGTNEINHPGNAAQPYLRPAYEIMMGRIVSIAAGKYPG